MTSSFHLLSRSRVAFFLFMQMSNQSEHILISLRFRFIIHSLLIFSLLLRRFYNRKMPNHFSNTFYAYGKCQIHTFWHDMFQSGRFTCLILSHSYSGSGVKKRMSVCVCRFNSLSRQLFVICFSWYFFHDTALSFFLFYLDVFGRNLFECTVYLFRKIK